MSLNLDGDATVVFPSEGMALTGAFTMLLVIDIYAADGAWQAFMTGGGTDDENGIGRDSGNDMSAFNFSYSLDSFDTAGTGTQFELPASDGYVVIAARRSSGTGPVTFSKKILGSGSWAHRVTTAGSAAGGSSASGYLRLGGWRGSDLPSAYYAVAAVWDGTALTDPQIESTDDNLATADIYALTPSFLADDSDAFATNLMTSTSRTSATGLGAAGPDPSGWTYGTGAGGPYVAAGTAATASSGNVTAANPAGIQEGDALILDVTALDNVDCSVAASGGSGGTWTRKGAQNNGTGLRKEVWWSRRGAGDTATGATVTHAAGGKIVARMHAIRVPGSGDPFEAFSFETRTAGAGDDFPDITTLTDDAFLMYGLGYAEDFTVGPAIANAQGLTITERDETQY